MSTVANGAVSVSYRPLTTMDELHVLLLVTVSAQNTDLALLEQVFSLPSNVIAKELAVLEAYGLAQKVGGTWMATDRGQRISAVWSLFNRRGATEVMATGRQWLLGPGDFSIDEMIRDKEEIDALACASGVADAGFAVKFLDDRRKAAEGFEAFVRCWPHTRSDRRHGVFAESLVFDAIKLAETDDSLTRLGELLATAFGEVVARSTPATVASGDPTDEAKAEAAESLRKSGQDVLTKFEDARRTQRKVNRRLSKTKATCEAWLAGQWLSANVGSLREVFGAEPAAFVFRSTVPLVEPEAPKRPTTPRAPSPPPTANPKRGDEGILRSLFRWLFG